MSLGSLTQLLTKANESVVVLGNQNVLHCQYENQITTISKTKIDQEFCRVKCYDRRYRTGASWKKQKGEEENVVDETPGPSGKQKSLTTPETFGTPIKKSTSTSKIPVRIKKKKEATATTPCSGSDFAMNCRVAFFSLIFWKVCLKVKNPWEVAYAKRNWSGWKKMKRLLCGNPYGEYRTENTENSNRTTSEKRRRRRQRRRAQKGGKLDIQN